MEILNNKNKSDKIKNGIFIFIIALFLSLLLFSFAKDYGNQKTINNSVAIVHINDTTIKGKVDYYKILSTGFIEISIGGVVYTTNIENVSLMINEEE